MSAFPIYVKHSWVIQMLRELCPGQVIDLPARAVIAEFTRPSQVLDLIFGPSEGWKTHFQKEFGDSVELVWVDLESDVVTFRHWHDLLEVPYQKYRVSEHPEIAKGIPTARIEYETRTVIVDRRTREIVG